MRAALSLLVLLGAALASGAVPDPGTAPGDGAAVRDAWIALAPPGTRVMAGYLVLDNQRGEAIWVVGVEVSGFARAELHETVRQGPRMTMRMHERIEVAAGARLEFKPESLHLMLFDPTAPPAAGDTRLIALLLSDGTRISARARVRDRRASADPQATHH